MVVAALGADVQILLEIGRGRAPPRRPGTCAHRPSGIDFLLRLRPRLIFGGSSFWSQLMSVSPRFAASMAATHARAGKPSTRAGASPARRLCSMFFDDALPMTTASATAAMRAGGRGVADAETDADRHADLARGSPECARATSSRSMAAEPVTPFSET